MMFDTANLPEIKQRAMPIEHIGMVISTCGTAPYVHLQLAQAERLFGVNGIAMLVVNDGDTAEFETDKIASLCDAYGASFQCGKRIGHGPGDLLAIDKGLKWAKHNNIQVLAKFSRRYVPLTAWRHQLLYISSQNPVACAFGRSNMDERRGLFRTDCIAFRVSKWINQRARSIFDETYTRDYRGVNVEKIIGSLTEILGGVEWWDLVGKCMHRPHDRALQWRGILPCHYGDLARDLKLPYKDADFFPGLMHSDLEKEAEKRDAEAGEKVKAATKAKILDDQEPVMAN